MAKDILIGTDSGIKTAKEIYIGVNDTPKRVKLVYVGVNNLPKLCFFDPHFIDYLCFTAGANTNIAFNITGTLTNTPILEYSFDKSNWFLYTFNTTISLNNGDNCYWRRNSDDIHNGFSEDKSNYINFTSTDVIYASGNIMSLLDNTGSLIEIPTNYCFGKLFNECRTLYSAPNLPAIILKKECYIAMFNICYNLNMGDNFNYILPARELPERCYRGMFNFCSKMQNSIEILGDVLSEQSLYLMFTSCSKLKKIKVHFTDWNNGSSTSLWVSDVNSTGTFYCPELLDTTIRGSSTIPNNWQIEYI